MVTKSRSDWGVVFSVVSIFIAIISIGYCFPHILEMIESGWERSSRAIAYFSRIIRGGAA
ncbi:hypothetical protein MHZ92_06130 [Sporosarcina sp. ACRSL]|uniref:hypothetical protein n=1 Tax=Sporosarcina sp. ACRSL TaxID=2918215 RepID=UPI001EF6BBEF|nr:hypothetical protein [Sporosarcina sp. ACRSL]MCG7343702.1 hypothetical protein [Sporosarcina sp. ACRSL]